MEIIVEAHGLRRSKAIPYQPRLQIPKPKLIKAENDILRCLGIDHHLFMTKVAYYVRTSRVTVGWDAHIYGKNTRRFWQLLDLEKEPWTKSEKVREAVQKIRMKKV